MKNFTEQLNDWKKIKLRDAFELKQGSYISPKDFLNEGYDVYGANGIIGKTDKYNHDNKVVLVSCRGANCGVVHFTNPKSWVNNNSIAVTPKDKNVLSLFLYYKFIYDGFKDSITGSAQPQIVVNVLGNKKIILPTLLEQNKIADILSTVDENINKTDQIIQESEKLKKGLMQRLLTKGIGHKKFKKTKLGEIPEEWEVQKGEDISDLITKGASPKWQGFDYTDSGTLFVTSENVRSGYLDVSVKKFLPLEFHNKLKKSQLKKNDILINIVGASIGRSCIFNIDIDNANTNQAVCLMRVKNSINPNFINQHLQDNRTIERLLNSQGGSARQNLSLTDIRNFVFVIPSREEQNKITEILSEVDNKIDINKQIKNKLSKLKRGLMQDLLEGKVRVK